MIEMNNKLKKEIWSINTKGTSGPNAKTDIAFGITEDGKSALRIDDKILTGEGGSIPTITIDDSQFIADYIQLTAEQADIFKSNAPMIKMNGGYSIFIFFATDDPSKRSTVVMPSGDHTSRYIFASVDDDDKCYTDMLLIATQQAT